MKINEVNIRDPFIVSENGKYYMFGTRAANFGIKTAGFDVYISEDLENWSEPIECLNSAEQGLNDEVNWAPEVWKYNGKFYMLATFTQNNGLKGTFALVSQNIFGPYVRCSDEALTPKDWQCLDGTLYIDRNNKPYLVFSHEHIQIIDGTICYVELKEDFSGTVGEPAVIFAASEPYYVGNQEEGYHYVTDGPFMYRTKKDELIMLWSTFIDGEYAECMALSDNGEIDGKFVHIEPLYKKDGGHGMIFEADNRIYLTLHKPNAPSGAERPVLFEITEADNGKFLAGIEDR